MLIRKACVGVTLAATLVLGTSLFAAEERFSFTAAGAKDSSINRAYADFDITGNHAVPERLNFSITRYATDAERDTIFSTASSEGVAKVGDIVRAMPAVGYINWPGGSSYTIRYARRVARPDGGLDLVMITDGRAWPWWSSGASFSPSTDQLSVIQVRMNGQGVGEAKVSSGNAISANKDAGVVLDYAKEPVVLADVRSEKGMNTATLR